MSVMLLGVRKMISRILEKSNGDRPHRAYRAYSPYRAYKQLAKPPSLKRIRQQFPAKNSTKTPCAGCTQGVRENPQYERRYFAGFAAFSVIVVTLITSPVAVPTT